MHIKNLLANSAIQNMISQQQHQQGNSVQAPPQNTSHLTVNTNSSGVEVANANKIRKRKNNSINNKLIVQQQQQKENSHTLNLTSPVNNINNTEQSAIRLFEQFRNMQVIQMSQPHPNTSSFSVNILMTFL